MAVAEIKFEREGLEGVIPVGSYLGDALRRFGVKDYDRCNAEHDCVIEVKSGGDLLSPMTDSETEYFKEHGGNSAQRLACHARIEREGEIVVMTKEQKQEEPTISETESDQYRKQFAELPLDKKISELVKLEALALGETVSYIVNSPFAIFEKVGDIMADFGMKLEKNAKEARRPTEHSDTAGTRKKTSNGRKEGKTAQDDKEASV
jgi:ferredoxin